MDRRVFLVFAASTAVLPQAAVAQNNARTVKIGWLTAQQEVSLTPYLAAMRQGFSELGYVEGQNLLINYRFGNDQLDRVPELAAELVKSGVELIVGVTRDPQFGPAVLVGFGGVLTGWIAPSCSTFFGLPSFLRPFLRRTLFTFDKCFWMFGGTVLWPG